MKKNTFIGFAAMLVVFTVPMNLHSQEEKEIDVAKSAEVFLEDYSDDFQENFFEALKQKGIENYDKAINLFLKCKQLDANNRVVDHELAKAYIGDKKYTLAQGYAVAAVLSEPDNPWYLETLVAILEKQGNSIAAVASRIPYDKPKLKENLALIYFKRNNYEVALKLLKELKKSSFSEGLTSKINDSLKKKNAKRLDTSLAVDKINTATPNPIQGYRLKIEEMMRTSSHVGLLEASEEALETYPSQPFFYYAQGFAFNKNGKYREAIEILEAGLDYLVNDQVLANKFYKELAAACTATNNTVNANMYLSKIKSGF